MYRAKPPVFPAFAWNDHSWITSAVLPAWSGYQVRHGPYGSVSKKVRSEGLVHIVYAPERPHRSPLSDEEIKRVAWLIENEAAVHDAMLQRLFEEYPVIREYLWGSFDEEEFERILPAIRSPGQLKEIVGISSVFVHQLEKEGKPFIGVELGCEWDVEHGVGVLLCGSTPLKVGGADTAFTLWMAKAYLGGR